MRAGLLLRQMVPLPCPLPPLASFWLLSSSCQGEFTSPHDTADATIVIIKEEVLPIFWHQMMNVNHRLRQQQEFKPPVITCTRPRQISFVVYIVLLWAHFFFEWGTSGKHR